MSEKLQQLLDEREIVNVVNSIGVEADRRNWDGVESAFADEVLLDYSSMGQQVERLKAAEIVERWKGLLPGFRMTQHTITNHRVTVRDNEADCFSYVNAVHHLPNEAGENVWTVVGFYEHRLLKTKHGWRVDRMKLTATLVDGNNDLPKLAEEAVKTKVVGS